VATLFFHFDGVSADPNLVDQRQAILNGLQAWANVVQITFIERCTTNAFTSIDFDFVLGDHSAVEPQEAGDSDCPFDGTNGILAHAGFPPGAVSACINMLAESFAGNVHFDEAESWEDDNANGAGSVSLRLIACHEIGHAIGLAHTSGSTDVMRPTFSDLETFAGLSSADITNIRSGYAAGVGQVLPLETTGVWVDRNWGGPEEGTSIHPFNTIAEGIAGVPPASRDVSVNIEAGTYVEPLTINRAMHLVATNGTVTIGP
jgi:hypothetical protein